jgi:hypothetical protein
MLEKDKFSRALFRQVVSFFAALKTRKEKLNGEETFRFSFFHPFYAFTKLNWMK